MEGRTRFPLWISNLLVFGFLCAVAVGYFLWQIHTTREAFFSKMQAMTALVARIIELNVRGAVLSQQTTEEILYTFLGNTARFVDYLDTIEPFNTKELTEFAKEARLSGICIIRAEGTHIEGPDEWLQDASHLLDSESRLNYDKNGHLYTFSWPRLEIKGWVVIGIEASKMESLQQQLGLPNVIETINKLPGIAYVKEASPETQGQQGSPSSALVIVEDVQATIAESKFFIDAKEISIGLDATPLTQSIKTLWRDFTIFSSALACLGILLSYLLYRQQSLHVGEIRAYERKMSEERQDAALGRAAASIAHEIRNPLNSLSMGLQRLKIEGNELNHEHRHFIEIMLDAVQRTNNIVTGLLHYASPQYSNPRKVRLDLLLENIVPLYQARCNAQGIELTTRVTCSDPVAGDPGLLSQVLENLLKNALEAQPHGGFIKIEILRTGDDVIMNMTNGGFSLPPEEAERITEPYFTTKASGTGLGLAIARRIITAHGGHLSVTPLPENTIAITIKLPVNIPGHAHHNHGHDSI